MNEKVEKVKARTFQHKKAPAAWGSDAVAELLRALAIPYIALTVRPCGRSARHAAQCSRCSPPAVGQFC
jgi:hypothetical protein